MLSWALVMSVGRMEVGIGAQLLQQLDGLERN